MRTNITNHQGENKFIKMIFMRYHVRIDRIFASIFRCGKTTGWRETGYYGIDFALLAVQLWVVDIKIIEP